MRRNILAAGIAVAVVATGLAATVTARPASAALSDVPADCFALADAYRTDGQRLTYRYDAKKTSTEALPGDNLGWVPTALVPYGGIGADDWWKSQELATHPTDGNIYHLERQGDKIDGVEKITVHKVTRVAAGFGGTRFITMAWPYLYRAEGTSLYRYKFAWTDGTPTLSDRKALSGGDWETVQTLDYQRTIGTGATAVDVLTGTKSNGQLKEWRISHAAPAVVTSKVLKASGWGNFVTLGSGFCGNDPTGRPLLGITPKGVAAVYFDANAKDGLGTDIKGGSLGLVGWTEKSY
ncbi:hypothetical protein E1263_36725 [Kribbella antibiotica]|uniref:Tat pathway signal sequence domain protein n=1 Tax=Kribbella antibiotica TaxID=190195 RepID=A0A4R4YQH1_9ACTN|nr:hypothetical protein [Kribbella antibiotica]TDD46399.1 hypothetical protein E1263_36725 [Kribbella antibiotica]